MLTRPRPRPRSCRAVLPSSAPIADDAAALFYQRAVRDRSVAAGSMFPEDMTGQRKKLMQMLTAAVKGTRPHRSARPRPPGSRPPACGLRSHRRALRHRRRRAACGPSRWVSARVSRRKRKRRGPRSTVCSRRPCATRLVRPSLPKAVLFRCGSLSFVLGPWSFVRPSVPVPRPEGSSADHGPGPQDGPSTKGQRTRDWRYSRIQALSLRRG